MADKRIKWIDKAQVISMIFVVFHHSIPNGYEVNKVFLLIAKEISFPALAVFFFCSGILSSNYARMPFSDYIKHRAVRLLIPYFFINLFMIIPKWTVSYFLQQQIKMSGGALLEAYLYPHSRGICQHLWFLLALFIMSLSLPLLSILKKKPIKYLLCLFLFALSIFPIGFTTLLCINEIRLYAIYFTIGYFWSHKLRGFDKLQISPTLYLSLVTAGVICIIALLFYNGKEWFMRPVFTIFGGIFIVIFAFLFSKRFGAGLCFFENKTYIIYILSHCIQNFVEVFPPKYHLDWVMACGLMFFCGIVIPCIIFCFLIWLDGKKPIPKIIKAMVGI